MNAPAGGSCPPRFGRSSLERIGCLLADELNSPRFDLLWRERAQFDGIALLAFCLTDNVSGDLAQRLRVTLKRLWRKETPCGHGFDVLADRDVDLFDCWVSTTAAHDDFPPIDADVRVQFESERGGVFLIRCSKPEPTASPPC